jgi:hypothetical protein
MPRNMTIGIANNTPIIPRVHINQSGIVIVTVAPLKVIYRVFQFEYTQHVF